MSDSQIVDIQIKLATAAATETNFGLPLIASYHTNFPERVRSYSSLQELLDDGFTALSPTYLAASAMLAQSPSVPTFKVGRRALAYTQGWTLTPTDTTEDLVYSGEINGNAWSVTVQSGDAVEDIIDDIKVAIDALGLALTTTDNTTDLGIAADNAGDFFSFSLMPKYLDFEVTTADPGIATDLAAISEEDDDWYILLLDSQSKAEMLAAADYTAPRTKVLFADSADSAIKSSGSSTDVAAQLQTNDEPRALLFYHENTNGFLAAGFAALHFSEGPGSANPANRELSGISVSSLTTSEQNAILAKSANIYVACKGVDVTRLGTMADGEYLDNIQGKDWLKDIIESEIITLLGPNSLKVPFTDAGISAVKSVILAQLKRGQRTGFLSPEVEPVVTVPLASAVSAADKASRTLTGVTFLATLANAVNAVEIRGTLTN